MARTIYYLHPSTPEPTASVACQQKAKTQSLGFVGTFSAVITGSAITSVLNDSFLATETGTIPLKPMGVLTHRLRALDRLLAPPLA